MWVTRARSRPSIIFSNRIYHWVLADSPPDINKNGKREAFSGPAIANFVPSLPSLYLFHFPLSRAIVLKPCSHERGFYFSTIVKKDFSPGIAYYSPDILCTLLISSRIRVGQFFDSNEFAKRGTVGLNYSQSRANNESLFDGYLSWGEWQRVWDPGCESRSLYCSSSYIV